jgi:hypothetical protein
MLLRWYVVHGAVSAVQEGVLCFCRLFLALGATPSVGGGTSVPDLLNLVMSDINAAGFTW